MTPKNQTPFIRGGCYAVPFEHWLVAHRESIVLLEGQEKDEDVGVRCLRRAHTVGNKTWKK